MNNNQGPAAGGAPAAGGMPPAPLNANGQPIQVNIPPFNNAAGANQNPMPNGPANQMPIPNANMNNANQVGGRRCWSRKGRRASKGRKNTRRDRKAKRRDSRKRRNTRRANRK
jgi:hypothetical protein